MAQDAAFPLSLSYPQPFADVLLAIDRARTLLSFQLLHNRERLPDLPESRRGCGVGDAERARGNRPENAP
eukprot:3715074-Pyramimonas_sp.AAC.1